MVSTNRSAGSATEGEEAIPVTVGDTVKSGYRTTIGLEVHAQLLTESKMYCACRAGIAYAQPNSHVCPVCMGMPGTLPVINAEAVRKIVLTGLALDCTIPHFSKFDRKNYPYPDLMKGYQISQYDLPLCIDGHLDVETTDERGNLTGTSRIGIHRVHLEEDTARLLHRTGPEGAYTLMDVNRAGLPLMEIVSAPDIESPEQAQLYLMQMRHLLRWLGVSTGNMEEGAFRVDANVSVRPAQQEEYGTKVEIKNMNSFKAVRAALEYEVERQIGVLEGRGRIVQETRGWVDGRNITVSQRSKEQAHDYRYFPEPDLPPLTFTDAGIDELRKQLPELPRERQVRFVAQFGISIYDAAQLTASRATADYFEQVAGGMSSESAKIAASLIVNDLAKLLSGSSAGVEESKLTAANLRELVQLVSDGTINRNIAKGLLPELYESGRAPGDVVHERGLAVVKDDSAMERIADEAIIANPKAVADYKGGKESALASLIGQIMKATKGQADANAARELLKRKLNT